MPANIVHITSSAGCFIALFSSKGAQRKVRFIQHKLQLGRIQVSQMAMSVMDGTDTVGLYWNILTGKAELRCTSLKY